jgi:BirA family biotin operon repressor/biotin-[acetyl-CoA-carboxylase] ligase
MTAFLARREDFTSVGSTNDVVRGWLAAGTDEVCLAVADEQAAGRGRAGRHWVAPAGGALLLSVGFRPTWLEPERAWRLAAVVSLAMAEAAESVAGLPRGRIRLKWPNDLVIGDDRPAGFRKVGGVLGETDGLGTDDPRVVVGIGINADWAPADFPSDLAGTMTSLGEARGGPIDRDALLFAFLADLETRVVDLRDGRFAGTSWADRQVTTGRTIRLETPAGDEVVRATGVDVVSGALLVENTATPQGERQVLVGEVTHVRLADPIPERV